VFVTEFEFVCCDGGCSCGGSGLDRVPGYAHERVSVCAQVLVVDCGCGCVRVRVRVRVREE